MRAVIVLEVLADAEDEKMQARVSKIILKGQCLKIVTESASADDGMRNYYSLDSLRLKPDSKVNANGTTDTEAHLKDLLGNKEKKMNMQVGHDFFEN